MYDLRIYHSTKDMPGGPIYVQEQDTAEYLLANACAESDDRPIGAGRLIGGLISGFLLLGTGVYLFTAW